MNPFCFNFFSTVFLSWNPEYQSLFSEIKKEWVLLVHKISSVLLIIQKNPKVKKCANFKCKYNTYVQKYSKTYCVR